MKRGNDNGHMSRVSVLFLFFYVNDLIYTVADAELSQEEVEAGMDNDDNNSDDGAERGTFKRASADVIAGRKIVKIKGRFVLFVI